MKRIILATALLLPSAAGATEWLSRDGQSVFSTAEFGTGYLYLAEDMHSPAKCDLAWWPANYGEAVSLTCEGFGAVPFHRKNRTTVVINDAEFYLLQ